MLSQRKMVDTATGASPPRTHTREMASSPINFDSSIQISTSDDYYDCSTTINQEKSIDKEFMVMKRIMSKNSISPFPSPSTNESNNSSPVLSSITSTKPLPLMSIGMKDGCHINSNLNSSAATNIINK
ncbi:unnamed protein product [Rotaria sordida]|uniref:Uncharacterized protein n=2 Tax=Rotaria sordida TaxID=392033 RepID=A0A819YLL6_9BILA|nr:unnamed protein product [Rotaria sordida]